MDRSAAARARAALAFVLVALAFFALGLVASRRMEPAERPDPTGPTPADAGAPEPRILFDPSTIQLLPDASLRLDLPPAPDAGSTDRAGPR